MHADYLVKMTNEIAAFFAAEAGPEATPREVAGHLRRFWDPRMRAQIIAHLAAGGEGLEPAARHAVTLLAEASRTAAPAKAG